MCPTAENIHPVTDMRLVRIEPDDRLVVLARTINAPDLETETTLKDSAVNWARLGETCLGQSLYKHRAIFQTASEALVWSHVELSYFRNSVPAHAIRELVTIPQSAQSGLLRAEILLTSPSSFVLPRDWQGSVDRPDRQASLEFINVHDPHLDNYRIAMRDFCGPAATKLVRANKYGTFRAMETAVVLFHDPELKTDWNQIHLCELEPDGFVGFGPEFEGALREGLPDDADLSGTFADLDRMRTVPRWTFNDTVVEEDIAVAREGQEKP